MHAQCSILRCCRRLSQAFGSVAASNQGMAVAFGLMPTLAAWATSVVQVCNAYRIAKLRATQRSGPDTLAPMHVELSLLGRRSPLGVYCVCAIGCVGSHCERHAVQ